MTRKKNIARKQRWVYYVEMLPDDVEERPGFNFLHAEDVEPLEFDHEPSEADIARAISKQGFKVDEQGVDGDVDEDGRSNFKGDTDDGAFFFSVDPDEENPELPDKDRKKNPMRKQFWRPEPPHGDYAKEYFVDPMSTKGAVDTGKVVAVSGQGWAPCSIIIAKVFRSKRTGELFYTTKDSRHTTLDSDNSNSPIYAREMGWDGPLSYTPDQVDEMFERMEQQGPCSGLTQDEFDDADSFFSDREGQVFDDPGYF